MRQLKITGSITQHDNQSLDKYLVEISHEPLINPEEERELAQRIKRGDSAALEKLIKANLRFVVSVAKQYQNQWVPLPDLINEGNIWLIKAAQKFDETKGFKFISYAVRRIRQSIQQSLIENARIVRLPSNKIIQINKIENATFQLAQIYHREPTTKELADVLELTEDIIQEVLEVQAKVASLDKPIESEDQNVGTLMDVIENNVLDDPDTHFNKQSLQIEIMRALSLLLTPQETIIVKYFFGLDPNFPHGLTLEEIAKKLDLTREKTRQIKEKAIRKLKNSSRLKHLQQYR